MASRGPNQLLDLLRALRRRRYQVLVPALLVATVGIAFAVIVPKRYKLSTRIEISDRVRIESDFRLRNPQETAVRREAPSAFEHVVHFERVKNVIERDRARWPEYVALPTEMERAQFIRERITNKNLDARPTNRDPKSGTIFVDILYSDEDRDRAAAFLTDLSRSWLEEMKEMDRATLISDRDKLREIVDDQEKQLKDVEDNYYRQMQTLGHDPTTSGGTVAGRDDPQRGDWAFRALEKLRTQLTDVEMSLKTARVELEQAETRLRAEPAMLSTPVKRGGPDGAAKLLKLHQEREQLEDKLAALRPTNSTYKRLKPKLDEIVREIAEIEGGADDEVVEFEEEPNPRVAEYEDVVRKQEDLVVTLTKQRDELVQAVESLDQDTKRRIQDYKVLAELEDQVVEARRLVNETRKEWADRDKSLQMLDSAPPPWRIAQPPVASTASAVPNPGLVSAFAVVAGLALGVALALGSEYLRSCYRSVGELASVMSVPVLGAIDTIVTRRERRRVQLARAVGGLSTAMIVGTIAWVTYLWQSAPDRLPLELQDAIEELRSSLR